MRGAMLEKILAGLGWLLLVSTLTNIAIKLFGTEEIVLLYAGSSRNVNAPLYGFAIGLMFLGLSSIIKKLDKILQRDETPPK